MRPITADNIDHVVQDLKDDLKIEKFSSQEDALDQLLALAVKAFDYETTKEDYDEQLRDLKDSMREIEEIAGRF